MLLRRPLLPVVVAAELLCGVARADGITLHVDIGAGAGDVTLAWTGSQPMFAVLRGTDAATVTNPANLLLETTNRSTSDSTAAAILFYRVMRKPDPPATLVDGAEEHILLSGTVVSPSGPFEGELLVEGNLITCVAPSCAEMPAATGATVITTHGIILPGLIDAHNHGLYNLFDEADWTPLQPYTNHNQWTQEERYPEVVDAKQYLNGEGGSPVAIGCEMDKFAEIKALVAGTTSFLAAPGLGRSCYASVVRTIDTLQNDLGQDKIQTSISVPSNSSAQSVCDNFATDKTDAYVVHVAEGTDLTARNEFSTLAGRAGGCLLAPETTIVHGTALGSPELTTMAANGMKLVWSPRSNVFLYGETTPIDLALAAGVSTIALAPDWALGGSVNLLDELRFADRIDETIFGDILTPEMLFQMVTINAARALAVDGLVGSLETGKRADITVIGGYGPEPYNALLLATPASVRLVMVDGRVLYGETSLVAAGPASPGCESTTICGGGKFLCVSEDSTANKLNQTYVEILQTLVDGLADYDANVLPAGSPGLSPIAPLTTCPDL